MILETARGPKVSPQQRTMKDSQRDIPAALENFSGIIYFVYGEKDPDFPAARTLFEEHSSFQKCNCRFHIIPAASHNFNTFENRECLINFLKNGLT